MVSCNSLRLFLSILSQTNHRLGGWWLCLQKAVKAPPPHDMEPVRLNYHGSLSCLDPGGRSHWATKAVYGINARQGTIQVSHIYAVELSRTGALPTSCFVAGCTPYSKQVLAPDVSRLNFRDLVVDWMHMHQVCAVCTTLRWAHVQDLRSGLAPTPALAGSSALAYVYRATWHISVPWLTSIRIFYL